MHKVLVVEDNKYNLQLVSYLLKRGGFEVFEMDTGVKAVDWLNSNLVDLVLLDIQMPDVDGLEILRRIRSNGHSYNGMKVVALTAYAMQGDKEQFTRDGFDGYISKPLNCQEFASQVLSYIDKNGNNGRQGVRRVKS
jgi:CheY-like chemotaxis protein